MKVKYIRVSTIIQNEARQKTNSNEFDNIYVEKISGSLSFFERKVAKQLIVEIEKGKINEIHISSIDRLGRDILDILKVVKYLSNRQINLFVENIGMYSLIGSKPNASFKMIISVLGNVAEMERLNMLERQREGISVAIANGKYKGRLYGTKMSNEDFLIKYKKVKKELEKGESLRRAALIGGVSLGTAQKVKRLIA